MGYGEAFTVPVFHKRITFLIGPKVSEHFFKAKDTEMSQKEVYEFNVPTFGKGVVFDVDHTTRAEQFRFFADSLKSNRLRQYVGMMVKEAEEYFGKWGDEGEVDLLDALSELIVLTASRCLLGREIRETLFSEVTTLVQPGQGHGAFVGVLPVRAHRGAQETRQGAQGPRRDLRPSHPVAPRVRRLRARRAPDVHRREVQGREPFDERPSARHADRGSVRGAAHLVHHQHVDRLAEHREQGEGDARARGGAEESHEQAR